MSEARSRGSWLAEAWDVFVEVPVALQAAFWVLWFGMGILVGAAIWS